MGAGGLGGVLIGSSAANKVVPPAEGEEQQANATTQASYANTGSSPAGYTADPDEDFSDEDLDKYASWQSLAESSLGIVAPGLGSTLAMPAKIKQFNQQEAQQRRTEQQQLAAYRTANAQPKIQGAPSPQPLVRSSGGLVWGTQQPWNKTASAPPQQAPQMPPNQLARRPVGPTLPPSPGIAPAASKAGAPPTGGVETIANKVQGAANEALDMQAKQAFMADYIAFISFLLPEKC